MMVAKQINPEVNPNKLTINNIRSLIRYPYISQLITEIKDTKNPSKETSVELLVEKIL